MGAADVRRANVVVVPRRARPVNREIRVRQTTGALAAKPAQRRCPVLRVPPDAYSMGLAPFPMYGILCVLTQTLGRGAMRAKRLVLSVAVVVVGLACVQAVQAAFLKRVTIYDTRYTVVEARDVLSKIPQAYIKTAVALSRYCPTAKAYGFYGEGEAGIVAYAPRDFLDCFSDSGGEVTGGGPGGPGGSCLLYYTTRTRYVAVLATKPRLCARLTTQAPSAGYQARANTSLTLPDGATLAAHQGLFITCQRYQGNSLLDYILLKGGPVPGDARPYWLSDDYVDTGGRTRLTEVPLC